MSPKIAETGNLRIVINLRDDGNPHVHVIGPGADAKIYLNTLGVEICNGFSPKALRAIVKFIGQNNDYFLEKWNEIYKEKK